MRLGLDFDNTLADYEQAFLAVGRLLAIPEAEQATSRAELRRVLRATDEGEQTWRRLQGRVYGAELPRARLFPGVLDFLSQARADGIDLFVVSHKTEFGHFDPDRVSLHQAARAWMSQVGLTSGADPLISPRQVYFEPTRAEKIARIRGLGLDAFIDDLREVLDDPDFL
ncbi:MAG: phosphotransferase enzyme domain protein, partial [Rhodospirillales bacterium]